MAVAVTARSMPWSGVGQRWAWSEAFWEGPRVRGGVGGQREGGSQAKEQGRLGLGATFSCTLKGLSVPGLRPSQMLAAGTGLRARSPLHRSWLCAVACSVLGRVTQITNQRCGPWGASGGACDLALQA